jgi:hypothetical protein
MARTDKEKQNAVTKTERRQFANLLNENHRRSLGTVLRRVELAAWRLEDRITRGEAPTLALTRFTHPPDSVQKAALLQLTKRIRQEVAELASDYNLEVAEENLLRSVMGEFTLLWCDLEDSRPQKLGRYGAIDPQAYKVLGPPIQRLIELMLAINDVTSGKQETVPLWQEVSDNGPEGRVS